MIDDILHKLVDDASLVADVGIRLGRLKDATLLEALSDARMALATGSATPRHVVSLQSAFSAAIVDLAPITFADLRGGWAPYAERAFGKRVLANLGTAVFFAGSILLAVLVAYMTLAYDRGRNLYATTIELQQARGAEQAIRLLGTMKKNQPEVIESLKSGKKDFLYEAFAKALFDLKLANSHYEQYQPFAAAVLQDLNLFSILHSWVPGAKFNPANPDASDEIASYIANYSDPKADRQALIRSSLVSETKKEALKFEALDIHGLMRAYLQDIDQFNQAIGVSFNLLTPYDYSFHLVRIRDALNLFGTWLLPSLYGMLGAVVFQMRRLLDPNLPNPSWLRFTFRVVLGGFAGVILVSLWLPPQSKLIQPEFATLTSFSAAFIVGFSTDVFFYWLDRVVTHLSRMPGEMAR